MMILALVVTSFVIYAVGRLLLRVLGWPTSLAAAGRWCQALLVLALLFSALPEILRRTATRVGPLPVISLGEVIPGLCILGLVALGYVAWNRRLDVHEGDREQARTALQPRRRALPLPPQEASGAEDGFRPRREGGRSGGLGGAA